MREVFMLCQLNNGEQGSIQINWGSERRRSALCHAAAAAAANTPVR